VRDAGWAFHSVSKVVHLRSWTYKLVDATIKSGDRMESSGASRDVHETVVLGKGG
jgi:hypothetical protein